MHTYSYRECLEQSYKVSWRIDDVVGEKSFDRTRRWLPKKLSAFDGVADVLDEPARLALNHVEMGAYAHIFGYVEEFIAPTMSTLSRDFDLRDKEAFDALTNFVAEEVKHMHLFRRVRTMIDGSLGFPLRLLDGATDVARIVVAKNQGAVLLLTSCIEWFTQLHYVTAFKEDETLDPLTKEIFRAHWLEESQHAKLDHLETLRAFAKMSAVKKDEAIEDLIFLVEAVDGLLQKQSGFDLENLELSLRRELPVGDRRVVLAAVLAAKRYTFLASGITHERFQELFGLVTNEAQRKKVGAALGPIVGA